MKNNNAKPKLSFFPPNREKKPVSNDQQEKKGLSDEAKAFISEAGSVPETKKPVVKKSGYPWLNKELDPKKKRVFNVRMNEIYHEKLDWLYLENDTRESKHKIVIDGIYSHIDKEIEHKLKLRKKNNLTK